MLFNRSIAALVAGDLDVALSTAEESVELEGEHGGRGCSRGRPPLCSRRRSSRRVKPSESVEVMLTRAGGEEDSLIGGGWRARFLEVLTRAAGDRQPERRRTRRDRGEGMRRCRRAAQRRRDGDLAAAAVAFDEGDPTIAAERALAAAEAFRSVSAVWDAARGRKLAGRALAEAGERDSAAHQLELAAAAFDSFGSVRYRDQAERELRKLGRHTHRRTRPGTSDGFGIEALTERELQVARLVVDRKTNPEIAAELFLSQKTVETHLRNIFNKLGVADRVALARAVERSDRTGSAPPSRARAPPPLSARPPPLAGVLAVLCFCLPTGLAVALDRRGPIHDLMAAHTLDERHLQPLA